jgi:hypothetical protein
MEHKARKFHVSLLFPTNNLSFPFSQLQQAATSKGGVGTETSASPADCGK